eukprot:g3830.t1
MDHCPSAFNHVKSFGDLCGSEENLWHASNANKCSPILQTHDARGFRVDKVDYQPSYHTMMKLGIENGAAGFAWQNTNDTGAHVARSTLMYLMYQLEPALQNLDSKVYPHREKLLNAVASLEYDSRSHLPIHQKNGATIGMSMTEKQGGSDVRANSTLATPVNSDSSSQSNGVFTLIGHKWFTSAPMSDAFLTLARTSKNSDDLSCFLVPRVLPSGEKNRGFRVMRLKEKLGDRSNASSEVEYHDATGFLVGKEGRGVRTILDMVVHTRLDCIIGSSALMRSAAQRALHHCEHRSTFGLTLAQHPAMRAVLAELALESEAHNLIWQRLARSFDICSRESMETVPLEHAFRRIATAIGKYYVCKRAPHFCYEAMECFGGSGYVESNTASNELTSPSASMPRLFRQSPLNAIWEGSGNIIALDIVRALSKEPQTSEAIMKELNESKGYVHSLDAVISEIEIDLTKPLEVGPRYLADKLAIALECGLMFRFGHPELAKAFCNLKFGSTPTDNHEKLRVHFNGGNYGAFDFSGVRNPSYSGSTSNQSPSEHLFYADLSSRIKPCKVFGRGGYYWGRIDHNVQCSVLVYSPINVHTSSVMREFSKQQGMSHSQLTSISAAQKFAEVGDMIADVIGVPSLDFTAKAMFNNPGKVDAAIHFDNPHKYRLFVNASAMEQYTLLAMDRYHYVALQSAIDSSIAAASGVQKVKIKIKDMQRFLSSTVSKDTASSKDKSRKLSTEESFNVTSFVSVATTAAATCGQMLALSFVYYFLAWYIGQLFTAGAGASQHVYFLFTPSYWGLTSATKATTNDPDADLVEQQRRSSQQNQDVSAYMLTKSFKSTTALDELSLKMSQNEIFCLLGQNGAGKTTAINCITGQCNFKEGEIFVLGKSTKTELNSVRKMISICRQDDILFHELSAEDHLIFWSRFKGLKWNAIMPAVRQILKDVSLEALGSQLARTLSGGQKRRLSVGISCLGSPKVVFLDEPTTGLDPLSRRRIWRMIQKLKIGKIVILTTHSMEEADALSDRIGILHRGRLRALGTSLFLKNRFGKGYTISVNVDSNRSKLAKDVFKKFFKNIQVLTEVAGFLCIAVPKTTNVHQIVQFFKHLEHRGHIEKQRPLFIEWGISNARLTDVFLRVCVQNESVNGVVGEAEPFDGLEHESNTITIKPSGGTMIAVDKETEFQPVVLYGASGSTLDVSTQLYQLIQHTKDETDVLSTNAKSHIDYENEGVVEIGANEDTSSKDHGIDLNDISIEKEEHLISPKTVDEDDNDNNNDDEDEVATLNIQGEMISSYAEIQSLIIKDFHIQKKHRRMNVCRVCCMLIVMILTIVMNITAMMRVSPPAPVNPCVKLLKDIDAKNNFEIKHNCSNRTNDGAISYPRFNLHTKCDTTGYRTCLENSFIKHVTQQCLGDNECSISGTRKFCAHPPKSERAQKHCIGGFIEQQKCNTWSQPSVARCDKIVSTIDENYRIKGGWCDCEDGRKANELNCSDETIFNCNVQCFLSNQNNSVIDVHGCSMQRNDYCDFRGTIETNHHVFGTREEKYPFSNIFVENRANAPLSSFLPTDLVTNPMSTASFFVGYENASTSCDGMRVTLVSNLANTVTQNLQQLLKLPNKTVRIRREAYRIDSVNISYVSNFSSAVSARTMDLGLVINSLGKDQIDYELLYFFKPFYEAVTNLVSRDGYGYVNDYGYRYGYAADDYVLLRSFVYEPWKVDVGRHFMKVNNGILNGVLDNDVSIEGKVVDMAVYHTDVGNGYENIVKRQTVFTFMMGIGIAFPLIALDDPYVLDGIPDTVMLIVPYGFIRALHLSCTGGYVANANGMTILGSLLFLIPSLLLLHRKEVTTIIRGIGSKAVKETFNITTPFIPSVQTDNDVINEKEQAALDDAPETNSIVIRDLHKSYGEKAIVKGISIRVKENEVLGLLGANGAGKSTTIKCLTGLTNITKGECFINGKSVGANTFKFTRSQVGLCPQFDVVWPTMTVREHLLLYARLKGVPWKRQSKVVQELSQFVGLWGNPFNRQAGQLSGGMRRRLSLAMALIGNPKVIILDEPTTGLDPETQQNIWKIIQKCRKNRAVILTTHAMEEADALSTRIAVMAYGEVRAIGSQLHLKSKFGSGYILTVAMDKGKLTVEKEKVLDAFVASKLCSSFSVLKSDDTTRVFRLGSSTSIGNAKVSQVFEEMRKHRRRLQVKEWHMNQTTLDEVFCHITEQAMQEEEEANHNNSTLQQGTRNRSEVHPV